MPEVGRRFKVKVESSKKKRKANAEVTEGRPDGSG